MDQGAVLPRMVQLNRQQPNKDSGDHSAIMNNKRA
jgi:hypothetical protein